jgi:putative heme-binding domain-containing protein
MVRARPPAHLLIVLVSLASTAVLSAQAPQAPPAVSPARNNPHLGNKESIRSGLALYRVRCADCHGLDAKGYRGPDLTAILGDMPDEKLFQTLRKGVSGTEMPASTAPDDELLLTIAYLRNLGSVSTAETPSGNVENGQRLFTAQCTGCHRIGMRGGRLGPDLTRIGASRSRSALVREIRTPAEWFPPGYETVTLVTKDGQRIRGTRKNEDVYSIQVMDTRERIQGYLKADLREVIYEKESLMPAFTAARLSDGDLNDLIGYLTTLRGSESSTR